MQTFPYSSDASLGILATMYKALAAAQNAQSNKNALLSPYALSKT